MEVNCSGSGGGGGGGIGPKTPTPGEEPSNRSEEQVGAQPQPSGRKRNASEVVERQMGRVRVPKSRMLTEISLHNLPPSRSSGWRSHHWLRSTESKPITSPPKLTRILLAHTDNATLMVEKEESGVQNNELAIKRKKVHSYRPKVVKDLPPTPKPVTPSPAPAEKRLYGRKRVWKTDGKNITNSFHTSSEDIDLEMTISDPLKTQSRISCRRHLTFDSNDTTLEQMNDSNPKVYGKQKAVAEEEEDFLGLVLCGDSKIETMSAPEIIYDASEGAEKRVDNNIEQLESETKLLERVESFMTSMKVIQGDRHFSRWKGSVLDSVVGAFLAQNVGDRPSSSAFMSLAAHYPIERNLSSEERRKSNITPRTNKGKANEIKIYIDLDSKTSLRNGKEKGGKVIIKEENKVDWEGLRKLYNKTEEASDIDDNSKDALDWFAVNYAEVNEVSEAIACRGMNHKLAARIKKCLCRLMEEHGSLDLEWLRDLPHERARDFLLSIRGMGTKSVECIRLLTLQHAAFPVDTNVARIAVRLGWVPLQPLPEGVQFHHLKENPEVNSVHEFLSKRLLHLKPEKLKELHVQMITFGKVFCTKTNPNCNACPMRGECKRFASEYASDKLNYKKSSSKFGLSGPPQRTSTPSERTSKSYDGCTYKLPAGANLSELRYQLERDIEDLCMEIDPPVKINTKAFMKNIRNYVEENHIPVGKDEADEVLTDINTKDVFLPLKNQNINEQLRTQHDVYELPDSHPLLERLDKRDKDDHCPYLLATWRTGGTENSSQPSKEKCDPEHEEEESQTLRGTLLIPCRTATRGIFPLDGTYFQTNEVFADYETSMCPIKVSQELIDGLRKNTVYCGNAVRVIYRGLPIQEILFCFQKGYVCLRGFNRQTRKPTSMETLLRSPDKSKKKIKINML